MLEYAQRRDLQLSAVALCAQRMLECAHWQNSAAYKHEAASQWKDLQLNTVALCRQRMLACLQWRDLTECAQWRDLTAYKRMLHVNEGNCDWTLWLCVGFQNLSVLNEGSDSSHNEALCHKCPELHMNADSLGRQWLLECAQCKCWQLTNSAACSWRNCQLNAVSLCNQWLLECAQWRDLVAYKWSSMSSTERCGFV